MGLLMLFLAPVLQIVLSVLRYHAKIRLPIGVSMLLMLGLGFLLSYWTQYIENPAVFHPEHQIHPTIAMTMIAGCVITFTLVTFIALIAGITYHYKAEIQKW